MAWYGYGSVHPWFCPGFFYPSNSFHVWMFLQNIWVNYNISLTWIKAILGWFPLLTMISSEGEQWGPYNLPRKYGMVEFWSIQVCPEMGELGDKFNDQWSWTTGSQQDTAGIYIYTPCTIHLSRTSSSPLKKGWQFYPLVNSHNFGKSPFYSWVIPLFLWPFSIANC